MADRQRRRRWTGSVYQRKDGRWVASLTYPTPRGEKRRRKLIYGRTREEAEAKLAEVQQREPDLDGPPRNERIFEARDLGQHGPREWIDVLQAARGFCFYCRDFVGQHALGKDHRVPVSRGGSDSIENIAPCCWPCNHSKANLTDIEYVTYLATQARLEEARRRKQDG